MVGAGAVGQVYGHHLARGGARVAVLVKPRRRKEAEAGYTLTRVFPWGSRRTETFTPEAVLTNPAELMGRSTIDQIWFCVPTDLLDQALLADVANAAPSATIVVLAPGHFVRRKVEAAVASRRAVFGSIGMISYVSPLEGSQDAREQKTPAGICYALSATKFSGVMERRALQAVSALRAGGCPTDLTADATTEVAFGSAFLMPIVATLELAGWSMKEFASAEHASLAASAIEEALNITSALTKLPKPAFTGLLSQWPLAIAARLAPVFMPLDIESFLRVHFTKVGAQTKLLLDTTIRDGEARALPVDSLRELVKSLERARAPKPVAPSTTTRPSAATATRQ